MTDMIVGSKNTVQGELPLVGGTLQLCGTFFINSNDWNADDTNWADIHGFMLLRSIAETIHAQYLYFFET